MTRWDIILLAFICILSISFSYAVIKTAAENMTYEEQKIECTELFDKGTEGWFNCMKENR